jgi:hypothetical protein
MDGRDMNADDGSTIWVLSGAIPAIVASTAALIIAERSDQVAGRCLLPRRRPAGFRRSLDSQQH